MCVYVHMFGDRVYDMGHQKDTEIWYINRPFNLFDFQNICEEFFNENFTPLQLNFAMFLILKCVCVCVDGMWMKQGMRIY